MSGTEGSASSPWRACTENRRWTLYRKCMEEGKNPKKLTKLPCNSIVYFPAERAVQNTSAPCLLLVLEKLWSFGLSHVFKKIKQKTELFCSQSQRAKKEKYPKLYFWNLPSVFFHTCDCCPVRGSVAGVIAAQTLVRVHKCCSFTKVMPNRAVSWKR